ncbi:mannonate dehydratase [Enterobacter cancerogenus]|uniref:Mannonate dehydratase n=1 Tax=Enterobacter cancerogenus TaxID=69218 RepID=A0A484YIZ2_9ENTR|nr:mannonate dehydratase [Enterobacter cancerogenus]
MLPAKPISKSLRAISLPGLPGAEEGYTLDQFRARLAEYGNIDKNQLRDNMAHFLRAIVPVAEEVKVRLAIHPDRSSASHPRPAAYCLDDRGYAVAERDGRQHL